MREQLGSVSKLLGSAGGYQSGRARQKSLILDLKTKENEARQLNGFESFAKDPTEE